MYTKLFDVSPLSIYSVFVTCSMKFKVLLKVINFTHSNVLWLVFFLQFFITFIYIISCKYLPTPTWGFY